MQIRKIVCIILAIMIAFAATAPLAYAKSYTAYLNKTTYVYQYPRTSARKVKVSKGTQVTVTATSGSWARIKNPKNGVIGYIQTKYLSKKSETEPTPTTPTTPAWKSKVVKMNWFDAGKSLVKKGSYATIYMVDKGVQFRIKRMGGKNHMDVEPATASDTAIFKKAVGSWSWKSYAVILIANGKYVACGINAMPHGDQTIKNNNFDGQFCLHMVGSRTHETDSVNQEHQKSINRAYNWAHK